MAGHHSRQDWLREYQAAYDQFYKPTGESSMNINEVYKSESDYLKAEDLKGKTVKVTIESAELKEFENNGKKETKLVLSFVGKEKKLVLNSTNAKRIALNIGSEDTDYWKNGEIQIYPTQTDFGGKMVDCIRVREMAPELVGDTEF